MSSTSSRSAAVETPIERFVWDLTYACPLRCIHCFTESGRRASSMLGRDDAMRVVDVILSVKPSRISFGGGEPLLAPWWQEAAQRLCAGGVPVTLFTSGWLMDEAIAAELAESVAGVVVSVDGADAATHDAIRGRRGSFDRAMSALALLDGPKRARAARGESSYVMYADFTVTRSNRGGIERFLADVTTRFPALDQIRFGAVVPEGLAQEESFAARELLSMDELVELSESEPRLRALSRSHAEVSVTDARCFLPGNPHSNGGDGIAHIEADGQFRAFTTYEAKVGNVLREPITSLWQRALDWRNDPFVSEQRNAVRTLEDWARVTRLLDRRYGSKEDLVRIARRGRAVSGEPDQAKAS